MFVQVHFCNLIVWEILLRGDHSANFNLPILISFLFFFFIILSYKPRRKCPNKKSDRTIYHFNKRSMKPCVSDIPNHTRNNYTWSPMVSECNPRWQWNCNPDKQTCGELSCYQDAHRTNSVALWSSKGSHLNRVYNYSLSWHHAEAPVHPLCLFPATWIMDN